MPGKLQAAEWKARERSRIGAAAPDWRAGVDALPIIDLDGEWGGAGMASGSGR